MKRIALFALMLGIVLCLTGCQLTSTPAEKTAASLGHCTSAKLYTQGEDTIIEYGKYSYSEASPLDSKYFTRALSTDIVTVGPYIENFESRLAAGDKTENVAKNYDYDYSAMEKGDFFYITDRDGDAQSSSFSCYSLYIFDRTDNILYYFHVES